MTPLKAIRAKCLDCCCWNAKEVRLCTATKCPLHEYRFGKNPALKGRRVNNLHSKKQLNNDSFFNEKALNDKFIEEVTP